jgi:hypothetical protein
MRRFNDAISDYDNAIDLRAEYPEVEWNKGLIQLLQGDFKNGWQSYEWRWKTEKYLKLRRDFTQPQWVGHPPLAGKTIVIHSEQGIGDTIQFCRYLPLVSALGARVVFEIQKPLLGFVQRLPGVGGFLIQGDLLPEADFHCPLLSLPLALGTTLETIPPPSGDLRADPNRVARWAEVLGEKQRKRIGLVWSGNVQHSNDHNRSIPLSLIVDSLPAQYDYISLHKEVRDSDRNILSLHSYIKYFGPEIQDFSDTAALCALMDLVISVDTSVAHLSGTLGRPTWVLLPYLPDWRWLLDRDDSPWYPSVKLYRQTGVGDWKSVLAQVNTSLELLHLEGLS